MTSKAAVCRENITIDVESKTWTCNMCFQDRLTSGSTKPLKNYAYIGSSNIARHFMEFHRDMFLAELAKVEERRQDLRKERKFPKPYLDLATKKPRLEKRVLSASGTTTAANTTTTEEATPLDQTGGDIVTWEEEEEEEDYSQFEDDNTMSVTNDPLPSSSSTRRLRGHNTSTDSAQRRLHAAPPPDPLKVFFDAMYASVRLMSRPQVLHIRRKIFDMVSEMEELEEYAASGETEIVTE